MSGDQIAPILLVDDDVDICHLWERHLRAQDLGPVEMSHDGDDGWERLRVGGHRLCLLDLQMPGQDGLAVLAQARMAQLTPP